MPPQQEPSGDETQINLSTASNPTSPAQTPLIHHLISKLRAENQKSTIFLTVLAAILALIVAITVTVIGYSIGHSSRGNEKTSFEEQLNDLNASITQLNEDIKEKTEKIQDFNKREQDILSAEDLLKKKAQSINSQRSANEITQQKNQEKKADLDSREANL
ncbi:hypothetical protein [Schaalia sp. lx-100]|uniref:hypothetical protein n=1 Tax=Schaalia sp. lx-100 TaxID=2899081 RepID=UPI001E29FBBC|nr:hypothetical protein [Schaalia sp. lx-100]MCD4557530.1 hypothetical protein [Schaalia sp. lx-100]